MINLSSPVSDTQNSTQVEARPSGCCRPSAASISTRWVLDPFATYMYGKVTKDDVAAIVDEHPLGDVPVARLCVPPEIWG